MMEMGHHGEEGVEVEAEVGAEAEEATTWQTPTITNLTVVGAVAAVEGGAGVVVGIAVEAESKTLVVLTNPTPMCLREVGEEIILRRCHTLVGAEAGAEGEGRVEVREEGTVQTDPRKSRLQQELLSCRGQSTEVSVGIISLEVVL